MSFASVHYEISLTFWRFTFFYFSRVTVIFVYYGLTLNLGVLAGDVYLNLFLNSLFEVSVILFAVFFVDRFGRRKLTLSFMVASGITGMLTLFPYMYASKGKCLLFLCFRPGGLFGVIEINAFDFMM